MRQACRIRRTKLMRFDGQLTFACHQASMQIDRLARVLHFVLETAEH
jgi:hypothetical protein